MASARLGYGSGRASLSMCVSVGASLSVGLLPYLRQANLLPLDFCVVLSSSVMAFLDRKTANGLYGAPFFLFTSIVGSKSLPCATFLLCGETQGAENMRTAFFLFTPMKKKYDKKEMPR